MCFPDGALPEVQNQILKQFSHKVLCIFFGVLWSIFFFLVLKIWFLIVFSILVWKGSGFFLQVRNVIFWPNGLYSPPKQPWGSKNFDFDITTTSPLVIFFLLILWLIIWSKIKLCYSYPLYPDHKSPCYSLLPGIVVSPVSRSPR